MTFSKLACFLLCFISACCWGQTMAPNYNTTASFGWVDNIPNCIGGQHAIGALAVPIEKVGLAIDLPPRSFQLR